MQRARSSQNDKFLKVLQETCYAPIATEIVHLFRLILQTYHHNDGNLTEEELDELADQIYKLIPTAHKTNMVGVHTVYKFQTPKCTYRCTWRELLAKGSYNHVYYADLTTFFNTGLYSMPQQPPVPQPAVVKTTVEVDDFRVYILENVIHAVLSALPVMQNMVVPMNFAFKVPVRGVPPYALAVVLDNPGKNDLGDFIDTRNPNDDMMFSLLTTVTLMLSQAQQAYRFEHRDLKADNLMMKPGEAYGKVNSTTYPMFGWSLYFIDFGMTRFELDGEYIACDCLHTDVKFNPCHDLQSLLCTLIEDYSKEFQKHAPVFFQYISRMTAPIFDDLRRKHLNYNTSKSSTRHKRLCMYVAKERLPAFAPQKVLEDMETYWNQKIIIST